MPSISAVVLDMDGLLIDTEPVWRTAQAQVFAELGVELTEADLLESTGVRIEDVAAALLPGAALSPAEIAARITDVVIDYVGRNGEPMPGVPEAIALFERLELRLAIASSSSERLIDAVCARLGVWQLDRAEIRGAAAAQAALEETEAATPVPIDDVDG